MKSFILSVFALASVACFAQEKERVANLETSKIEWKGYKVLGSHEGKIKLKEGKLIFDNNQLKGGHFVVDMNTISVDDLQGDYANKLVTHLKSDDFFGTEKYPLSTLNFTSAKVSKRQKNSYDIVGDLTIKGKTLPVHFVLSVYGNKVKANLKIDRTQYGIKYNSGSVFDNLGDKVIYDEFDIDVNINLL